MTTSKKLTKGTHYDESTLEFVEWSNGEENESYNCWDYFDDGVYIGADPFGIEPLFVSAPRKMTKYTVRVQQSEGSIVTPVHVESTDVSGAICAAADHLALHGAVHRVDVYPGHDGWYDNSERLWTGSLNWSQESNAACETTQA